MEQDDLADVAGLRMGSLQVFPIVESQTASNEAIKFHQKAYFKALNMLKDLGLIKNEAEIPDAIAFYTLVNSVFLPKRHYTPLRYQGPESVIQDSLTHATPRTTDPNSASTPGYSTQYASSVPQTDQRCQPITH